MYILSALGVCCLCIFPVCEMGHTFVHEAWGLAGFPVPPQPLFDCTDTGIVSTVTRKH